MVAQGIKESVAQATIGQAKIYEQVFLKKVYGRERICLEKRTDVRQKVATGHAVNLIIVLRKMRKGRTGSADSGL